MIDTELKQVVRDAGFRATKPRLAFLATLAASEVPLPVSDIAERLGKKADLVTVYRIAESFEKAGIISRVELRAGKVCYEFTEPGHHHHHIVCTDCGAVEDVDACISDTFARSVAKESRFFNQINSHALEFFGTCTNCA